MSRTGPVAAAAVAGRGCLRRRAAARLRIAVHRRSLDCNHRNKPQRSCNRLQSAPGNRRRRRRAAAHLRIAVHRSGTGQCTRPSPSLSLALSRSLSLSLSLSLAPGSDGRRGGHGRLRLGQGADREGGRGDDGGRADRRRSGEKGETWWTWATLSGAREKEGGRRRLGQGAD